MGNRQMQLSYATETSNMTGREDRCFCRSYAVNDWFIRDKLKDNAHRRKSYLIMVDPYNYQGYWKKMLDWKPSFPDARSSRYTSPDAVTMRNPTP